MATDPPTLSEAVGVLKSAALKIDLLRKQTSLIDNKLRNNEPIRLKLGLIGH